MSKTIKKKVSITEEKIVSGSYDFYALDWFFSPYKNDLGVQKPSFQRVPNRKRVKEIIKGLQTDEEEIKQIGIISLAICKGVRYIIDGQHRLEAYKKLGQPSIIMCQIWNVSNNQEMKDLFVKINNTVPIENYIFNADEEKKLAYDELIQYVETTYKKFIKAPSTTGRNNFPNISSQTFRRVLPFIGEFENATRENVIELFETYNDNCKKSLKKKEDVSQLEINCKDLKIKPLYINRAIMKLWKEHASEING
jgi:hypothetical protein